MGTELLKPDDLVSLIDDPSFRELSFPERKEAAERALQEASSWMSQNKGWTPESFREFGEAAKGFRDEVKQSETMWESAKGIGGVMGQTVADSAAVLGLTAFDAVTLTDPSSSLEDLRFKAPLGSVLPSLGRGLAKAADAADVTVTALGSKADNAVDEELSKLTAAIDAGEMPLEREALEAWLQERSDAVAEKQAYWYHSRRATPPPTQEEMMETGWAEKYKAKIEAEEVSEETARAAYAQSIMQDPVSARLLAGYMQTRNPELIAQLSSRLKSDPRTRALRDENDKARDADGLAKFLKANFGEEAAELLDEAGDPMEWAGTVFAPLKGAKAIQRGRKAMDRAMDVGKGVGAEMLSEQGSLQVDDPFATLERRREVARDTFFGSLGLIGAGAGVKKLVDLKSQSAPSNPAEAVTVEGEGMTEVAAAPESLPEGLQAGQQMVVDGVTYVYDPMQVTADALRDAAPETLAALEAAGLVQSEAPQAGRSMAEINAELAAWADSTIESSRGQMNMGLDPTVVAAYAVKALQAGVSFAQWSAQMVRQFGAAVKQFLQDAWNAAKAAANRAAKTPLRFGQQALERPARSGETGAAGDLGPQVGAGEAAADPGMRRSQFGERVQADPRLSDELRAEAVSEFPVQGQQATHDQAREMIRGLGLDAALTTFRDDASLPMPLRIAGLMQVAQNFDAQGLAARVSNDSGAAGRADTLLESAVEAKVALESIGNEAGRNLAMFNTWARLSPTGMLARVDRKLAEMHKTDPLVPASIPAEVRPKLERQAAEAMALPEGVLRTAAVADLMAEVSLIEGVKAGDLWWSIWYGNVLSGLATQSINIAGSVENVLLSVAELGTLRPGMLADYIRGLARGVRQGAVEAWSVLRGGPVIKPGKWTPQAPNGLELLVRQGGPRSDFSSPRAGLRSLNEWAGYLASLGGNTRFVGRLLGGVDAFFYYTMHEGAASVAVQRALRKQGIKPGSPQFRQEVIRQMGRDSSQYQADLRQAEAELRAAGRPVTRQMVMRRAWELVRERRDQGVAAEVQSWADRAVYQNPPAGSGAWVSGLISQIQKLPVVGRLNVPFNTILANFFSRGLDYTGLGLARGLLGYHLTDLVAPPKGGRVRMGEMERRQRAIAGVIGPTVGLAAGAYALQFADYTDEDIPFWIYDSGPKDKQRRRQMPQGWQPHSIKVGKRYIKYAETPLGPLLGAVAGYINAERYASEDSLRHKTNGERLALALQASMQQYQDLGVLAGVADFMEVMSGQKRLDRMAQDTGARSLSGLVPVSGFLREVEALFDPEKIHAEGIMEALQRDIPVVSGWGTRPDLNAFAEPLTDPGLPVVKRFASTQKEDPNWSWVRRNELRVPAVDLNQQLEIGEYLLPNQARGKSLQDIYAARGWSLAAADAGLLTRDQRYHLAKRTGELMKERVQTVRKTMEQQPHGGVLPKDGKMQVGNRFVPARDYLQSRINAIFEASRKQAMAEVVEMATTR
jgi:hypothetical protein